MKRRDFGKNIAATALASSLLPQLGMAQVKNAPAFQPPSSPSAKPLEVGMLLYPDLTLLDLIGPQTVLAAHSNIHLIWKSKDVIHSDQGVGVQPNCTLAECPAELDILFVPGGPGMNPVMRDAEVMAFLKDRGAKAKYVTSVCTGSLVLGAAGLLNGYKATSHWGARHFLSQLGAEPVNARIVIDRNRVTGGGVTAGIDFGLKLLSLLRGDMVAKVTQLAVEYNPQPPFDAGSPEAAGPMITELATHSFDHINQATQETIALLKKGHA